MKRYFVTGIGTGVGKTIISAILTEKLGADYWKPIQSGDLNHSDTMKVKELVSNTKSHFHPEAYQLTAPMSPHASAQIDGVEITLSEIKPPNTDNHLVIEGAGGLMVPLNNHDLMIDLAVQLQADIILVSMNYLGSINHTLLSLQLLKSRRIPVAGIVFNGEQAPESEEYILGYSQALNMGHVPIMKNIDKEWIKEQSLLINLPL